MTDHDHAKQIRILAGRITQLRRERDQLAADNRILADQLAAAVSHNYADMEPDYTRRRRRERNA